MLEVAFLFYWHMYVCMCACALVWKPEVDVCLSQLSALHLEAGSQTELWLPRANLAGLLLGSQPVAKQNKAGPSRLSLSYWASFASLIKLDIISY